MGVDPWGRGRLPRTSYAFPIAWTSIPHRLYRGREHQGDTHQPLSDTAGMKRGHHVKLRWRREEGRACAGGHVTYELLGLFVTEIY